MCRNIRNAGSVASVGFGAESTHTSCYSIAENRLPTLLDCMFYPYERFGRFCNLLIAFIVICTIVCVVVVAAYAIRSRSPNANEMNERMNE